MEISGEIRIQGNDSLESFKGLHNLKIIRGAYMYLSALGNLDTLNGFSNLDTMLGQIRIFLNPKLKHIDAFPNLQLVGDRIMIFKNPLLEDIHGFNALEQVEDLRIDENEELISINAFDRSFNIRQWIVIRDNPNLSSCSLESICSQLDNPDVKKAFSGNASGCQSITEVSDGCLQTSVFNHLHEDTFSVYPNPAIHELFLQRNNEHVEWPESISLVGLIGKQYILPGKAGSLDVSILPTGIYIGQSMLDDKLIRFTIMKVD